MPKPPLLGKETVKLLKIKRSRLGLSEKDIAKKIGCRTNKVIEVENRQSGLRVQDLKKWASSYKINKSTFIKSIIEDQRVAITGFFKE